MKKIDEQLNEANIKNDHLKDKLVIILHNIENEFEILIRGDFFFRLISLWMYIKRWGQTLVLTFFSVLTPIVC